MKKHCHKRLRKNKSAATGRKAFPKSRGLQLLPYPIRENLPILGGQQSKGGRAQIVAKCFTTDGLDAWYITEGSARRSAEGQAVDYLLYGLAEGAGRKLDYFWLSDLATFRSTTGAPVERDSHWRPKSLAQIAPELFQSPEDRPIGKGRT
jgi:hypothetical protein